MPFFLRTQCSAQFPKKNAISYRNVLSVEHGRLCTTSYDLMDWRISIYRSSIDRVDLSRRVFLHRAASLCPAFRGTSRLTAFTEAIRWLEFVTRDWVCIFMVRFRLNWKMQRAKFRFTIGKDSVEMYHPVALRLLPFVCKCNNSLKCNIYFRLS